MLPIPGTSSVAHVEDNIAAAGGRADRRGVRAPDQGDPVSVWFITGASRGFGAQLVDEALARGNQVVATARRVSDIPSREGVLPLQLDVTDEDQAHAAVGAAVNEFGRIDVVVNNAGRGLLGAVEEATDPVARAVFDTNVFGVLTSSARSCRHSASSAGRTCSRSARSAASPVRRAGATTRRPSSPSRGSPRPWRVSSAAGHPGHDRRARPVPDGLPRPVQSAHRGSGHRGTRGERRCDPPIDGREQPSAARRSGQGRRRRSPT